LENINIIFISRFSLSNYKVTSLSLPLPADRLVEGGLKQNIPASTIPTAIGTDTLPKLRVLPKIYIFIQ
jgi:hypothetical protein